MATKPTITTVTAQADNIAFQVNKATNELAEAISGNLARDGSDTMAGNLDMNNYKVRNLSPPTSLSDSARLADIPDGVEGSGVAQLRVDLASLTSGFGIDLIGDYRKLSSYDGNLSTAISSVNSLGVNLIIDQSVDLGGATVDCLEVNLVWLSEGSIISNGTLNNLKIGSAGRYQIFGTDISTNTIIGITSIVYPEWFGCVFDGTTYTSDSLEFCMNFFDQVTYSFPSGSTAILDRAVFINGRQFVVDAYGFTFKMAPGTGYAAFVVNTIVGGQDYTNGLDYVYWFGATFDGNRENQNYTDQKTAEVVGTGVYSPENAGVMLRIRNSLKAIVRDVTFKEIVSEGLQFHTCRYAHADNVIGESGASPLPDAFPGTIACNPAMTGVYKITNCSVKDSNIAYKIQFGLAVPESVIILDNVGSYDNYQASLYDEYAGRVYVNNFYFYHTDEPSHAAIRNSGLNTETLYTNGYIRGGIFDSIANPLVYSKCENVILEDGNAADGRPAFNNVTDIINCRVINAENQAVLATGDVINVKVNGYGATPAIRTSEKVYNCEILNSVNTYEAVIATDVQKTKIRNALNGISTSTTNLKNLTFKDNDISDIDQSCISLAVNNTDMDIQIQSNFFSNYGKDTLAASYERSGINARSAIFNTISVEENTFADNDLSTSDWTYYQNSNTVNRVVYRNNVESNITNNRPIINATTYILNNMGVESANAETPTSALWQRGDIIEFTDSGDATGDGVYIKKVDDSFLKLD